MPSLHFAAIVFYIIYCSLDTPELPIERRDEQQKYDYEVRELGYRNDPMNILPIQVFGEEEANRMLEMRIGTEQIAQTKDRWNQ